MEPERLERVAEQERHRLAAEAAPPLGRRAEEDPELGLPRRVVEVVEPGRAEEPAVLGRGDAEHEDGGGGLERLDEQLLRGDRDVPLSRAHRPAHRGIVHDRGEPRRVRLHERAEDDARARERREHHGRFTRAARTFVTLRGSASAIVNIQPFQ